MSSKKVTFTIAAIIVSIVLFFVGIFLGGYYIMKPKVNTMKGDKNLQKAMIERFFNIKLPEEVLIKNIGIYGFQDHGLYVKIELNRGVLEKIQAELKLNEEYLQDDELKNIHKISDIKWWKDDGQLMCNYISGNGPIVIYKENENLYNMYMCQDLGTLTEEERKAFGFKK